MICKGTFVIINQATIKNKNKSNIKQQDRMKSVKGASTAA